MKHPGKWIFWALILLVLYWLYQRYVTGGIAAIPVLGTLVGTINPTNAPATTVVSPTNTVPVTVGITLPPGVQTGTFDGHTVYFLP